MDRDHRRRFGQNFLDPGVAAAIAGDISAPEGAHVLEIGPGHGALTRFLLARNFQVTAVEIDPDCIAVLQRDLAQPTLSLVKQDFLHFPLEEWCQAHQAAWIVGNLPYNVSTAIVAKILPSLGLVSGMMAMVQREVAERLVAEPGESGYGGLSVLVRSYARGAILRHIGPESFTPRPNVDSATFVLQPRHDKPALPEDFESFVHACFAQKRKQLANPLSRLVPKAVARACIEGCGLPPDVRAEQLDVDAFLQLHAAIHSDRISV